MQFDLVWFRPYGVLRLRYSGIEGGGGESPASINTARRQRESIERAQLQDAMNATGSRQSRRLQRDVWPRWLYARFNADPRLHEQGALVFVRNANGRAEPCDSGAPIDNAAAGTKTMNS